jgi:hypothetical protein
MRLEAKSRAGASRIKRSIEAAVGLAKLCRGVHRHERAEAGADQRHTSDVAFLGTERRYRLADHARDGQRLERGRLKSAFRRNRA